MIGWEEVRVGEFGFSWVGLAFLLALFVPNLIWTRTARPTGYDPATENRTLGLLERVGQVATTAAALLFADTNTRPWTPWSWWLIAATGLMVAYELTWVRYFVSDRSMQDFTRPLLGVPVPLAVLPIAAFVLLGIYGPAPALIVAALILGVGHIGIHLGHARQSQPPRDHRPAA